MKKNITFLREKSITSVLSQECLDTVCHSGLDKPAPYSIRGNPAFSIWIPAPHFRGDKFTPAETGAGMTVLGYCKAVIEAPH